MKTIKLLSVCIILLMSSLVLMGHHPLNLKENNNKKNAIVVLKFKAQPDKGAEAVTELKKLFTKVKDEPNFVCIKLHVDSKDDTNIMLYEEWESESYYNSEHMKTPHLKAFMENSRNFLAGPPEISFWKMKHLVE